VTLERGYRLDLGGIAKGWIAERAARILADHSYACGVNAGGDLFLCGLPAGETAWEIDLEDPRDPEKSLGVLRVAPGAVATSSIMKRRWRQGEQEQHHVIDPRTWRPAETPWLSVTVYATHAAEAEVWAKVLLIAGPLDAIGLLRNSPQTSRAFIAVDSYGHLWSSQNREEVFNVGIQSYA
jgi:thiamine biosynthesis lipoprotein